MQFTIAAVATLLAVASAHKNATTPVYTTEVVTAYTTYCPSATEITHGGVTYTVTEATTLTITDCPCTVTKPVISSSVVTSCPTCSVPAPSSYAPVPPPVYTSEHAPYPSANTTAKTSLPVGTGSATASAPLTTFTGAAAAATAAPVAGLAAVLGLAAYIL